MAECRAAGTFIYMSQSNSLFARIDALRAELNSLPPMSAEQQERLDKKMRLEFHYNTNHIEGNTLTYGETVLLFTHGDTRGDHTLREYEEMKASDVALTMIEEQAAEKERPISQAFIREVHQVLLKEPYWKDGQTPDGQKTQHKVIVGDYKQQPNNVLLPDGKMFAYTPPGDVPAEMDELITWYRERDKAADMHPVELAARMHYRFVRIHPFDDGNGRLSRLLMNYVLLRAGYPAVVIKSEDKRGYLNALHDADAGNLESFVAYIAKQEAWSLELALKAARGESIEEVNDWKKGVEILKRELIHTEGIEVQCSTEVVHNLLFTKLKPLIETIAVELSVYNDLFLENYKGYSKSDKHSLEDSWDFSISDTEEYFDDDFLYGFVFSKFKKKGADVFDVVVTYSWDFNLYQYKFTYQTLMGEKELVKLYHQDLTSSEKAEIIAESGKWVLAEIKKKLQSS